MIVKSVHDESARALAVEKIKNSMPVGIFNRGVCAIWGDGRSQNFYDSIIKIKGEARNKRPLAASLPTQSFLKFIDQNKISPSVRNIFLDAEQIAERTGSLCFIRVPIKEDLVSKLPPHLLSKSENGTYEMQNWDPLGHQPIEKFIDMLIKSGVDIPAVTSMNLTGEVEIVDQQEGINFCKKYGIDLFLEDEHDPGVVKGSFTILSITNKGLSITREGNIPGYIFSLLLGHDVTLENSIPSKYPQANFPKDILENENPAIIRKKILDYIYRFSEGNTL